MKIKQLAVWCSMQLNKERNDHIKHLESRLSKETNIETRKEIENILKQKYDFKTQGARVRSRINWFERGETSLKYFFNLEKLNGKEKSWEAILNSNGNLVHGTEHILNRQVEYYQTLY